jgi:hypothetical protein
MLLQGGRIEWLATHPGTSEPVVGWTYPSIKASAFGFQPVRGSPRGGVRFTSSEDR